MIKRLSSYFEGEGYRARAFRGSALAVTSYGAQNAMRLASNLILTRLLFPEAFGLMALVQVVIVGAAMFSDLGIRGSIIQHDRGDDPVFLNTAWSVQILRGFFLCFAIMALSGPIAGFYEEPLLGQLLLVAAISPAIQGFNSTRVATASRTIQLGRMTAMELGAQALGILGTIGLALWLDSVWALAIGALISPVVVAILSHLVLDGHPNRIGFDREALASLFGFGRFVFLATLGAFFQKQGARAVLGKFVALDVMAFYNIGHFLAMIPLSLATQVGRKVMYPLYARRSPTENAENRRKLNKARRIMTGGMLLVSGSLAVLGDFLIQFLYDVRYETAGPILVLIALSNMPQLIIQSYDSMPLAAGHSGRFATYTLFRAALQMGLLIWLVPIWGVLGAVVTPGLGTLLTYPLLIWLIRPYRVWDPVHDIMFAMMGLAFAMLAIWVNYEALSAVIVRL